MRQAIKLDSGFAVTSDLGDEGYVPLGDGALATPRRFTVDHPGTDNGPTLRMTYEVRNGQPTCVEVAVTAVEAGREVRNFDLRNVPNIDDVAEVAIQVVAAELHYNDLGDLTGVSVRDEVSPARRRLARQVRSDAPRRRAPVDLVEVAEVYEANREAAPTAAVAEHFGVSRNTASTYARRAHDEGYLAELSRGGRPKLDEEGDR